MTWADVVIGRRRVWTAWSDEGLVVNSVEFSGGLLGTTHCPRARTAPWW